jgi:hypothetical protein
MKLIIQLFKLIREEYILLTAFGPVQRKWLRFLKAHPEIRETNKLGNKSNTDKFGYKACCLGQFGLMTGICKWNGNILFSLNGNSTFPTKEDMLRYGFYDNMATHRESVGHDNSGTNSLAHINDNQTWLDVYNACINDPKGYFSKKV